MTKRTHKSESGDNMARKRTQEEKRAIEFMENQLAKARVLAAHYLEEPPCHGKKRFEIRIQCEEDL